MRIKTKQNTKNAKANGFSLFELLVVVGAVGTLAAVAANFAGSAAQNAQTVKLRNDVESLNEAVQVYKANGGKMTGVTEVGAALTKLKTRADNTMMVGLRGSMLDPRFEAEMMTAAEAGSNTPRAQWDPVKQRFVFATSGAIGAKSFYIDETKANQDALTEARETAVSYGEMTKWVWDYEDVDLVANSGVGETSTGNPTFTVDIPTVPASAPQLVPPSFSHSGGLYDFFDFDLAVDLYNPNPVGSSVIYYTLDSTNWNVYNGASILVGPGQELTAYSVSTDPDEYSDSEFQAEEYESSFVISGGADGDFSSPEGPEGMVTNLLTGATGSYFTFGTAADGFDDPSWLLFNGASFADVSANESFLLGTLDYFNGTILSGTQATSVGLSIDLDFDGGAQTLAFNYELELLSTANLEENTQEQNADFVRFGDLYSDVPVELGGVDYSLILEFGETTAGGFSNINEFHVFEGATASGNLYGRLVAIEDDGDED